MLWNVYSFFVTYARIDGFDPKDGVPAAGRALAARPLDRLARCNSVDRRRSGRAWTGSTPPAPTRVVERFVDDLSTWYVRRSRRRFWKAADDADKRAAQATLYEVLSHADAAAGAVPAVRRGGDLPEPGALGRPVGAGERPPHRATPRSTPAPIDPELERQVELARRLVGLGRAAREQAAIRVRQPLALARVGAPADAPTLRDELREEIERELNVERLEVGGDVGDAVEHVVQAKPALIGPRLGRKVQDVLKALRAGEQTVRPDGSVEVAGEVLTPDEVTISTRAQAGFAAAEAEGYTLVLDTRLTPELVQAGLARELVHRIQTMRKDAGFEVEDRIVTRFDADGELAGVFDRFGEYIKQETLSVALEPDGGGDGHAWTGQIEGEPVTIRVALRRRRDAIVSWFSFFGSERSEQPAGIFSRRTLTFAATALAVIALDRWTKQLAIDHLLAPACARCRCSASTSA